MVTVSKLKPQAVSLAIRKDVVCNTVVDRSINTAPVKRILSNAVPQFSMS